MATTHKKSSKKRKTTKTTTIVAKKGSESPLLAAMTTLDKALKSKDWRTDLDPDSLKVSLPHVPTGSIVVDYLIGGKKNTLGVAPCPGLPRGKIMQLYGHEGAGKCLTADTLVSTPEGLRTIEEIFNGNDFACTSTNWTKECETVLLNFEGVPEKTTHFTSNGSRPVTTIRGFSGAEVKSTSNHPHMVLSERGFWAWKKTKDLRPGDVLVSPRKTVAGQRSLHPDKAYLLGLILADGYLDQNKVSISNDDPCIKTFLEQKVADLPQPKVYPNNDKGSLSYHFNSKEHVSALYSEMGWGPGVAKDKHTGPTVRSLDENSLREVVRGYVDCKSYVDTSKGDIEVVSASFKLLKEVQQLLKVFGVQGLLREKQVAKYPDNDYWRLHITGEEARSYIRNVGTRSLRRSAEFEEVLLNFESKDRSGGTNFDTVPNCGGLLRDLYSACETNRADHHLCADYMTKPSGTSARAQITYNRLGQVLDAFKGRNGFATVPYARLQEIQKADYFYDEVVEVSEPSDPVPTFDFAMSETHSFIANGFVTHNTTLALTMAASIIEGGGTVLYIDWENEIVPYYAQTLGVPISDNSKFMLSQPESLEEGMVVAYTAAKHGVDLIVFDSVAAGVPKKLLEGKLDEVANIGQVGLLAALWSKFLPKLKATANKSGTAVVGISQLREKINTTGYGGETSDTQGGRAWKFYSALRVKLQRVRTEKTKVVNNIKNIVEDRVTGAQIKVKLDKCKVSPQQGNEEIMYIRQGEGIDDYRTIIEIGVAHNIIKKSGSWIEWANPRTDEAFKCQGMEKFRSTLIETEGVMQVLYEQVLPYLGATVTPVEDEEGDGDADLSAMLDAL